MHRVRRVQRLLRELNDGTPMATVLQEVVVAYLEKAATLFVADTNNHVIREVCLMDFVVRTTVGRPGAAGHVDGRGEAARFNRPSSILVDKASNTLLVGEAGRLRRVTFDGVVTTLCGPDALDCDRPIGTVSGIAVVGNNVFFSDCENHCIRKASLVGKPSSRVFVGSKHGEEGFWNGEDRALFNRPMGLVADEAGNLFVADSANHCIRKVTPEGRVSTAAGSGDCGRRFGGARAMFNSPRDVAFDGRGHVLVTDWGNHRVCAVNLSSGKVGPFAGRGKQGHKDDSTKRAKFWSPCGIAVDVATADVFVTCGNHTVRWVKRTGRNKQRVDTICGRHSKATRLSVNVNHADGTGAEATFFAPSQMALL